MQQQPPTQIIQATSATDPKQRLITAIRGYVHMDNLVESFNAQAANAREVRSKHETNALTLIKQLGLHHSTIQVSGATLQLAQRRTPGNLTWGYLEKEIPAWATQAGLKPSQAASLVTWLQDHREAKEAEYLKKGTTAPKPPVIQ
jgi:hypothetical protein